LYLTLPIDLPDGAPQEAIDRILDARSRAAFQTLEGLIDGHPITVVNELRGIGVAVARSPLAYFERTFATSIAYDCGHFTAMPKPSVPAFLAPLVYAVDINTD
jgi:hypothetical protein